MKKSLGLLTTGLLTFVLGGCGQSAQDAYTNALAEQANFEKYNGADISHTYDKKELADMIEFSKENGTDNMKEALQDADVDTAFENLEKFDITVSVDTKINKTDYKIVLADDDSSMDVTLTMSLTPKKEDTTITIPSDDKVITMEEFEEMMQNSVKYTVTDEEFDELYSALEDVKDVYTKEELQDMLEYYSFTDEQQTKIDSLYE